MTTRLQTREAATKVAYTTEKKNCPKVDASGSYDATSGSATANCDDATCDKNTLATGDKCENDAFTKKHCTGSCAKFKLAS